MSLVLHPMVSTFFYFIRASSLVNDFNNRSKILIAKLLKQGYPYHKLRKHFLSFIAVVLN